MGRGNAGLMDRSYSEAQYNIDSGHKKTLATGVEDTPLAYSNVRTTTKRFPARRLSANVGETQVHFLHPATPHLQRILLFCALYWDVGRIYLS